MTKDIIENKEKEVVSKKPSDQGQGDFRGNNRFSGRPGRGRRTKEKADFDSKTIDVARVSRVTKGGKRFSFRATVVIGDGKGMVGVGTAQGRDVAQAVQKATNKARKASIKVPLVKASIPHDVLKSYHSATVLIKPAPAGSGVKAGGAVRVVAKLAGIENLTAKLIERTGNKINIARATIEALKVLRVVHSSQDQINQVLEKPQTK